MSHIDLLNECVQITTDRGKDYGTAKENFEATSRILFELYGIKLTPAECVKVLIANKFARQKFKEKKDNVVDNINYQAICEDLSNNQ